MSAEIFEECDVKKVIASFFCTALLAGCSTPMLNSVKSGNGVILGGNAVLQVNGGVINNNLSNIERTIIMSLPVPPVDKKRENFCWNSPNPSFSSIDAQKLWSINHTWLLNAWAVNHRGTRAGGNSGGFKDAYTNNGYSPDLLNITFCMDMNYSIRLWQETINSSVTGKLTENDVKIFQEITDKIDPRLVTFRSKVKPYGNITKVNNPHKVEDALVSCSGIPISIKQTNKADLTSVLYKSVFNVQFVESDADKREDRSIVYRIGRWAEDNLIAYPGNCTNNALVTVKVLESVGLPAGRHLTDEAIFWLKKMY